MTRRLIIIYALLCLSSNGFSFPFFGKTNKGLNVNIDRLNPSEIKEARASYIESFASAYRQIPALAGQSDWETWLGAGFDKTVHEWQSDTQKITALRIATDQQLVGTIFYYAVPGSQGEIYVMQIAISEKMKREGLGKLMMGALALDLKERKINFSVLTLVSRKQNTPAIEFYKALGFTISEYEHADYDKSNYVGMELTAKGCGRLLLLGDSLTKIAP